MVYIKRIVEVVYATGMAWREYKRDKQPASVADVAPSTNCMYNTPFPWQAYAPTI